MVKFDLKKPYLTYVEATVFETMRKTGQLSIFKTTACKVCKKEIPIGKRYCSRAHFDRVVNRLRSIREKAERMIDDRWQRKR